jgi:hypothetical protein
MSDRPTSDKHLKTSDEDMQLIYAHFLNCVQTESSTQVLENFRRLFIDGRDYKDVTVRAVLQKIISSKGAEREFAIVLYRCCQIAIEHWYRQSELQTAIFALMELFEQLPASLVSASRLSSRCLQLTKHFTETEPYLRLKRLLRAIAPPLEGEATYLGDLLGRYPYLYKHCLLDEDCSIEYQRIVRKMRSKYQRNYEVTLAQYVTYRVRLLQIARARQLSAGAGKLLRRVENPTLLNGDELKAALRIFAAKTPNSSTTGNLSFELLANQNQNLSYKTFKENLYKYLVSTIDPEYVKKRFGKQLYEKLQTILPDYHSQKLSEFLVLRTYTQLLNFLVVESPPNLSHYNFTDLIANLGTTQATYFLFRLVMLYPKIKPHLETRLALLFEHYESVLENKISWFIKVLETFQIAFSIHFGTLDLSGIKLYQEIN